jgi:hypothetical protein
MHSVAEAEAGRQRGGGGGGGGRARMLRVFMRVDRGEQERPLHTPNHLATPPYHPTYILCHSLHAMSMVNLYQSLCSGTPYSAISLFHAQPGRNAQAVFWDLCGCACSGPAGRPGARPTGPIIYSPVRLNRSCPPLPPAPRRQSESSHAERPFRQPPRPSCAARRGQVERALGRAGVVI